MEVLEDGKIYRLDHNGIISFAYAETIPEVNEVLIHDTNRVWDITGYKSEPTDGGLRYSAGESYYEFSDLSLESAPEVFIGSIRTFKDLSVLEEFARRSIDMAESYEVNVDPDEVISFTIGDQDEVLALIKVTEGGDLFKWVGEDWIEVEDDDEAPEIFDRTVIDVERTDIGKAIELWKTGQALTKEDILTLADITQ